MKAFLKGFVYAGRGIWFCIRHERNFRIHLVVSVYVLGFAPAFSLTRGEWAALFLTLGMVLCAEALNTAVEHSMDLVSPGPNRLAGVAKDVAAGGVLAAALAAAGVGFALFGDAAKLAALGTSLLDKPWKLYALFLSLFPSFWFVRRAGVRKRPVQEAAKGKSGASDADGFQKRS